MWRLLTYLLLSTFLVSGQNNPDAKRDYVWVYGNNYYDCNTEYTIDFNSGTFQTNLFHHNIHLWANNSSISDTCGNLLFYSNGQQIVDKNGDIMENGDSIVSSSYYDYYNQLNVELSLPQSIIILPQPHYSNLYQIFHLKYEWAGGIVGVGPICTGLYMTTVDMNENNGLGKVIIKGQSIINDTLSLGALSAVRHGNGRDWWILMPFINSLKYYRLLLDPEGIHISNFQLVGDSLPLNVPVLSSFSTDGTSYVKYAHYADTTINIDYALFNRCTGILTPSTTFQLVSNHAVLGLSFSSNSRFLYISDEQTCYQFDLFASDIPASELSIAQYDGFDPQGHPTVFCFHKLAPDNKIYVGAGHSKYLHVINNPDLLGDSCNFVQRVIELPGRNMWGTMPNMPNFRLGRWVGSECDVLYNAVNEHNITLKNQFRIFPNPGKEVCTIEILNPGYSEFTVVIKDIYGHEVLNKNISSSGRFQNINISRLKTGTYIITISNNLTNLFRKKYLIINN